MSECIGYCEEKTDPTFPHPEYPGDVLCADCLVSYWEEDFDRYLQEMQDSITESGAESDVLNELVEADFIEAAK